MNDENALTKWASVAQQIVMLRQHPEALTAEEEAAVNKMALLLDCAQQRIEAANNLESVSQYDVWKQAFLEGLQSKHTRTAYEDAIARLEAFCASKGLHPTSIKRVDAELFLQSSYCRNTKDNKRERAPNCLRITLAGLSSFYGQLAIMSDGRISNPFLKMTAKPKKAYAKDKEVPSKDELDAILANTSGVVRCAIAFMAFRGFRIGALPNLVLSTRDDKTIFTTFTKGEEQRGEIPLELMTYIGNLSRKKPFEGMNEQLLQRRVQAALDKLARAGIIAGHKTTRVVNRKKQDIIVSNYSCHSFRHYFACTTYKQDKDIERLRALLNHSTLDITQVYLRSLGY